MNRIFEIAREIAALRRRLNLSQKEFGSLIGVSQQQVAKLESGQSGYSLATLENIARSLGLELMIGFEERKSKKRGISHNSVGPDPKSTSSIPERIAIEPEEMGEIRGNVRWFDRLSPLQKLRAVQSLNRASRRLLDASKKLRRSD